MTVSVCGHWEQSWNAPLTEAPMWAFPLRDFDIADWRMWPVSGVRNPERDVALTEYESYPDLLADLPDVQRVILEPDSPNFPLPRSTSLPDYDHPSDVVYIFGSAHFNPTAGGRLRDGDHIVTLPTARNDGVLWPHQVLVTVLHDRLVKSWR